MSETTNEPDESSGPAGSGGSGDAEAPEPGVIADEQLPDDLNPEKNPLARNPDEESEDDSPETGGTDKVEGMPDMGQPGAAG
jgi:hypothetical protein